MTTRTKRFHNEYMIGMPIVVGIHHYTQVWQILFCIEWWYLIFTTIALLSLLYIMVVNYNTANTVPVNPMRAGGILGQLEIMGKPSTWCIYALNISVGTYMYYNGLILAPAMIAITFSLAMINTLTLKPYLKRISQNLTV